MGEHSEDSVGSEWMEDDVAREGEWEQKVGIGDLGFAHY